MILELDVIIDDMEAAARSTPRNVRMASIEATIDDYIEQTGLVPDNHSLYRMTNVILSDDLANPSGHKSDLHEYPFLSRNQLIRRTEGRLKPKNAAGVRDREVPLHHATNIGADGQNYSLPIRTYVSKFD